MTATHRLPADCLESGASYLWLDSDGILTIINKPVAVHTAADAEDGVAIAMQISAGIPRPLLIDISDVKSMTREAREIYSKVSTEARVKAVGLVTRSAMSRILGNFFMSFNRPSVPIRLFKDKEQARKWLLAYV